MKKSAGALRNILILSGAMLFAGIVAGCSESSLPDDPITEPIDVYDVLQTEAAKGDKELGAAIVQALKVMAGEANAKKVYGKIQFREGSRVLKIARKYLKDGKDEAAKKEIRRLLEIIAPATGNTTRNTNARSSVASQNFLRQTINSFIPPAHATTPGRLEWDHGGTMVITYPTSYEGGPRMAVVNATQQAVNQSLDSYRALGLTSANITARLVPRSSTRTAGELVDSSSRSCTLNIYIQPTDTADDRYKQVVAHEVFHCFQDWNFRAQSFGRTGLGDEEFTRLQNAIGWWLEGTAEYFSNHVYPCVNNEHQFVAGFDSLSPTRSILAMEYEASVFFQHMANTNGNSGIIQLLRSLPSSGGQRNQAQALAGFSNMPETFHNFGKKYIDSDINDSCAGTKVPVSPRLGDPMRVTHGMNYRWQPTIKYFQIARKKLEFPPGRYYIKAEPAGDPAKSSAKVEANWKPLPLSLDDPVRCEGDESELRKAIVVATFVNAQTNNNYHLIDDEDMADRVVPGEGERSDGRSLDRCLIGTWALDNDNAQRLFNWMRSRSSGDINITTQTYGGEGRIDKHGNFAGSVAMTSRGTMKVGGRRPIIRSVSSRGRVTSCGRMHTEGGRLYGANINQRGQITVSIDSHTMNFPMNQSNTSFSIAYTCSGDTFTVRPDPQIPEFRLNRVGER
jgi:hypothetical protein